MIVFKPWLSRSLWLWVLGLLFLSSALLVGFGFFDRVPRASDGRTHYVSPNGRKTGTGSFEEPWDLATALSHPAAVKPGDTIWVRGGIYRGLFTSKLRGEEGRPIIVRQSLNERAIIDSGTDASASALSVHGSDTWYWGLEVMSSSESRVSPEPGPDAVGVQRAQGIEVFGPRTRFINMIVHDTVGAFGFWTPAIDSEIYGCLMYYNGWSGPDRGHGHGVYAQNDRGFKRIRNNIQFSGYGMGLRAYGTEHAFVKNIEFSRNVSFNSGVLYGDPPRHWANFAVTVGSGSEKIRFEENHSYHPPEIGEGSSGLGWVFSGVEKDCIVRKNHWVGGASAVEVWNWNDVTFEDNVVYSETQLMGLLNHLESQDRRRYRWDRNRYYGTGLMRLNGRNLRWDPWLETSGLDQSSTFEPNGPKGTWTFVYPNEYDRTRAHVIVYNWEEHPSVQVDLSSVLSRGSRFEVRDSQNYFAQRPLLQDVYNGGPVSIPMKDLKIAKPFGASPPQHSAPKFGVFIVLSDAP